MEIVDQIFKIQTRSRSQMVEITDHIQKFIYESGISNGDVVVYCPHTTGAITINENADPDVIHDMLLVLDNMYPKNYPGFRHAEGNSDSHIKSSLFGCSELIPIKDKTLVLGTWQGIYFCEFDGARTRKVFVQVRGTKS